MKDNFPSPRGDNNNIAWKQLPCLYIMRPSFVESTNTLRKRGIDVTWYKCKLPHEAFLPDFFTSPDNHQQFIIFFRYKMDDKADDFIWGEILFYLLRIYISLHVTSVKYRSKSNIFYCKLIFHVCAVLLYTKV